MLTWLVGSKTDSPTNIWVSAITRILNTPKYSSDSL